MTALQRPWIDRAAQWLLRTIWLGVIPALLAGLVLRYGVPPFVGNEIGWAGAARKLAMESPAALAAALWVLFSLLLRYWRFYLPGGVHLSRLPAAIAVRCSKDRLAEYDALVSTHDWATSKSGEALVEKKLAPEDRRRFQAGTTELGEALIASDLERARPVAAEIEKLAAPLKRPRVLLSNALWAAAVVLAGILALFMRRNVFESCRVLSVSMMPTLEPSDSVGIDRLAVRPPSKIRRGDLIVFEHYSPGEEQHVVKRVIGLPGDRIEMAGGHPVINGWGVPSCQVGIYVHRDEDGFGRESYLVVEFLDDQVYLTLQSLNVAPFNGTYEVKAGEYFVLGDNRPESNDSRRWNAGAGLGVPADRVEGLGRWFFGVRKREGSMDWASFLRPIGINLRSDGLNYAPLESGLEKCLKNRPLETSPPSNPISTLGPQPPARIYGL
jgi:signal peptidase I